MAQESRPDAMPPQLLPDADVAQIVLVRPRRPDDRLGAKASNHHAPCADGPVESQNSQRARNRKAQHRATVDSGSHGGKPPGEPGDTVGLPAELASALQIRKAQETLRTQRVADIEDIVKSRRT